MFNEQFGGFKPKPIEQKVAEDRKIIEGKPGSGRVGFGKKKRASSGGGSKGHAVFAYGKDGGKRRIGNGLTAKDARRDADWQRYRRNFAVDKFEVVNLDNDQVVDTMKG